MKRMQSDGSLGEQIAKLFFKDIAWKMFRHQPKSKVVKVKGKLTVIYNRSDGVADYTGYKIWSGQFKACEVKESHGKSMPASRLNVKQREWLSTLPNTGAFVGICWVDTAPVMFELFEFKNKGSYKQGQGLLARGY